METILIGLTHWSLDKNNIFKNIFSNLILCQRFENNILEKKCIGMFPEVRITALWWPIGAIIIIKHCQQQFSDDGLSLDQYQAISWTNVDWLSIKHTETNFNAIYNNNNKNYNKSLFKLMHFQMLSAKSWHFVQASICQHWIRKKGLIAPSHHLDLWWSRSMTLGPQGVNSRQEMFLCFHKHSKHFTQLN